MTSELEHLDTLEYNNEVYMAFFPRRLRGCPGGRAC